MVDFEAFAVVLALATDDTFAPLELLLPLEVTVNWIVISHHCRSANLLHTDIDNVLSRPVLSDRDKHRLVICSGVN